MLFAELDANGIAVIISAVGLVLFKLYSMFQEDRRAREIARKVEEVRVNEEKNMEVLETVSKQVEVVHKATNSMKDELVKEVRDASLAKGKEDERLRQKDVQGNVGPAREREESPVPAKVVFVVEDEGNKKALVIKAADAINDPDVQKAVKAKEGTTEGQG